MDFITENSKAVILALIAVVAGLTATVTVVIRKNSNSNNNNSNKITQRDNRVGGDMAGRDINKK